MSCSKPLYLSPVLFLAFFLVCIPGEALAGGINININLGPPPIVVAHPPAVVMVPNSRVYFVPDPTIDIFFYDGYWWSPRGTRWYRAKSYRGPWVVIGASVVPSAVVYMPRNYRVRYARAKRIEYVQWTRNRSRWERDNWKAHRQWEKEREKEWKKTAQDRRYDRYHDQRNRHEKVGYRGQSRRK
ncbi:MAG: hypothetical protein GXX84_09480 [Acidobacteria bacterium]|nr:hypothetical protein [Acidobacteriota bacterium]